MIITSKRSENKTVNSVLPGDKLNISMINALGSPVTARLLGGNEYWVDLIDVRTGLVRIDVSGKIDRVCFSEITALIDSDGVEHNPDKFWIE